MMLRFKTSPRLVQARTESVEMANDRCKNKALLRKKSVRGNRRQMHFGPEYIIFL